MSETRPKAGTNLSYYQLESGHQIELTTQRGQVHCWAHNRWSGSGDGDGDGNGSSHTVALLKAKEVSKRPLTRAIHAEDLQLNKYDGAKRVSFDDLAGVLSLLFENGHTLTIHPAVTNYCDQLVAWFSFPDPASRYPSDWAEIRSEIYARDDYTCQNCGATGADTTLHAHHSTPVSRGGGHDPANLNTLCKSCHQAAHPHIQF